jgi:hypothetical protein
VKAVWASTLGRQYRLKPNGHRLREKLSQGGLKRGTLSVHIEIRGGFEEDKPSGRTVGCEVGVVLTLPNDDVGIWLSCCRAQLNEPRKSCNH